MLDFDLCNGIFNGQECYSSQTVNVTVATLNLKSYFYRIAWFLSGDDGIVMSGWEEEGSGQWRASGW